MVNVGNFFHFSYLNFNILSSYLNISIIRTPFSPNMFEYYSTQNYSLCKISSRVGELYNRGVGRGLQQVTGNPSFQINYTHSLHSTEVDFQYFMLVLHWFGHGLGVAEK